MNRRLYYLFPDEPHARGAVDTLIHDDKIDADHIHAIARRDRDIAHLPPPTPAQREDLAGRLEKTWWNGNLALFGVALVVLALALLAGSLVWAIVALAVMGLTFFSGYWFTGHVPHVHLDEFRDALGHGEVLLMVDVPRSRMPAIETRLQRRHPEAVAGGSSWSTDAFGL